MEIRKSEVLSYIRKVENSTQKNQSQKDTGKITNNNNLKQANNNSLNLNKVRSKVLSIQSEVKDLQTNLSMNQSQVALLNTLNGKSNWSSLLTDAINKKFELSLKITENNAETYKSTLTEANKNISAELSKKDIQMQNILSSGMLKESDNDVNFNSLLKQISSTKSTFSMLEPNQVKSLIE